MKEIVKVENSGVSDANPNNTNKKVIFKNCGPFKYCITKINHTQVDVTNYIDIVMPMSNLT